MSEFPYEFQSQRPWSRKRDPGKILIIRFHALGDVAVTLPASAGLHARYPAAQIDFLTLEASAPLPRALPAFSRVIGLPPCTTRRERMERAFRSGVSAGREQYDVIVDLQRNWVSRAIRRLARPEAWGEFNRYAPKPAANRVLDAFRGAGFGGLVPPRSVFLRDDLREEALKILGAQGIDPERRLVVLNPAGLWETRNWPIQNYVSLVKMWQSREPVQFLLIGTGRIREKASYISGMAGRTVTNLVGKTTTEQAFGLLYYASALVTEDSGLMHMAWCLDVPIVALFGSSRHVWSSPTGSRSRALHSGDLPCGQCMSSACRFGDVHCLTRHTPAMVFQTAIDLIPSPQSRAM